jgi:hypothetical protein
MDYREVLWWEKYISTREMWKGKITWYFFLRLHYSRHLFPSCVAQS